MKVFLYIISIITKLGALGWTAALIVCIVAMSNNAKNVPIVVPIVGLLICIALTIYVDYKIRNF